MEQQPDGYAWDDHAGPIYSYRYVPVDEAMQHRRLADACQIVTIVNVEHDKAEIRQYYALTMDQAVARAADIRARLAAAIVSIRPTTTDEVEQHFTALDVHECRMPRPIQASWVHDRTAERVGKAQ